MTDIAETTELLIKFTSRWVDLTQGQSHGAIVAYGERGVWVPDGVTPEEVIAGAHYLEEWYAMSFADAAHAARGLLAVAQKAKECFADKREVAAISRQSGSEGR